MKNLYTVLLFCVCSASLLAQQLPEQLLERYPELAALEQNQFQEGGDNTPVPEEYLAIAERQSDWNPFELEWMLDDSTYFTYNTAGNYEEVVYYDLDENEWELSRRSLYTYNDAGQRTLYTNQSWIDGEWGQVNGDFQQLNSYDALGNVTEFTSQNWLDGEWLDNFGTTSTYYEGTDLLATELTQFAYNEPGVLVNDVYNVYEEYNSDGDLLVWTRQFWDEYLMEWSNKNVFERTYNNDGQLVLSLESEEELGQLNPRFQTIYTYDDEGSTQEVLTQRWENTTQEWSDYRKTIYDYNENGEWTLYESYFFDFNTQQLELSFRIAFTYFDHGGIDQYTVMVNQGGGLINNTRYTFTYYEDFLEQKTLILEVWNSETNEWENAQFSELFYDLFVDTDEQFLKDEQAIHLFPNPAQDQVTIQLTNTAFIGNDIQGQLYNSQGQLVQQYSLGQESQQISVVGLPVGSYWLKVSNGEQFTVKQLIIK